MKLTIEYSKEKYRRKFLMQLIEVKKKIFEILIIKVLLFIDKYPFSTHLNNKISNQKLIIHLMIIIIISLKISPKWNDMI